MACTLATVGVSSALSQSARRLSERATARSTGVLIPARLLQQQRTVSTRAQNRNDETDLTGEWPANWSLASYEDVGEFFENNLFQKDKSPGTALSKVMSIDIATTTPDTSIEEVKSLFENKSGLPVVKSSTDKTLVGVLSKKDLTKPGTYVKDIMSTPPIAARPDNKVADAACLMLKHKVHRIPVVDKRAQVVGIVTRTDIFTAMAMESGNSDVLANA